MTMPAYPQLETGALSQYPVRKRRRKRTVVNAAADGSAFKLADPAAGVAEWTLEYAGLTDGERAALETFFDAAEGTLNGFTFLDPTANLLAWSSKLDEEVWERGPFIEVMEEDGAWRVTNNGAAPQSIRQTLEAPGGYTYCLSVYMKTGQEACPTLLIGEARGEQRLVFTASGAAGENSIAFGIEIPAGASLLISGIQAEPQPGASAYKASTTSGVYEGARFADDELAITTTDVNRHACTVHIIHVNHL